MAISKDEIKVVEVIFHLTMKAVLVIAAIVAFFWILYETFQAKDLETKGLYLVVDSLWGTCIYQVFKHFFPAIKNV